MFDRFAQDLKVDPAVTCLANSDLCSFSIRLGTHVGYNESNEVQWQWEHRATSLLSSAIRSTISHGATVQVHGDLGSNQKNDEEADKFLGSSLEKSKDENYREAEQRQRQRAVGRNSFSSFSTSA